jgi:uncharacterized protein (DUF433 family)
MTVAAALPLPSPAPWPHVRVDARGVAWIDDTSVKVVEVALAHRAWGWSAELIHENLPHLSRAQVYAALAFYFEHQAALDRQVADDLARADAMASSHAQGPSRDELLRRRRAP